MTPATLGAHLATACGARPVACPLPDCPAQRGSGGAPLTHATLAAHLTNPNGPHARDLAPGGCLAPASPADAAATAAAGVRIRLDTDSPWCLVRVPALDAWWLSHAVVHPLTRCLTVTGELLPRVSVDATHAAWVATARRYPRTWHLALVYATERQHTCIRLVQGGDPPSAYQGLATRWELPAPANQRLYVGIHGPDPPPPPAAAAVPTTTDAATLAALGESRGTKRPMDSGAAADADAPDPKRARCDTALSCSHIVTIPLALPSRVLSGSGMPPSG